MGAQHQVAHRIRVPAGGAVLNAVDHRQKRRLTSWDAFAISGFHPPRLRSLPSAVSIDASMANASTTHAA